MDQAAQSGGLRQAYAMPGATKACRASVLVRGDFGRCRTCPIGRRVVCGLDDATRSTGNAHGLVMLGICIVSAILSRILF